MSTPATEWTIMTDIGRDEERIADPAEELRADWLRDEERGIEGADPDIAVNAPDSGEREEPVVTEQREASAEDQDTWPEEPLGSF